ncbi:hypothetical protein [Taibaiella koreensis]|uniref:hypothetical protein n=1 Tax=Taibaiella koreensis TaxID=1268548 RepID=UPI0013C2AD43|nr:hypothetical protein [Taibaiella koreensis]
MKKIVLLLLLSVMAFASQAQTFSEWFFQKKTQKKYLLAQIAALQVYIGYLEKGYKIADKGLSTISDIKNGDFSLHSLYFNSLKAVNPAVRQYPRVGDIIDLQSAISREVNRSRDAVADAGVYTPFEQDYIKGVYERLQKDCDQTITDLEMVTTPGKLEMKDDERIRRIDKLFADSQSQYGFIKSYSASLSGMTMQKRSGLRSLSQLNNYYGIK